MADPIRIFATGHEDYIEEDRPAIYASFGEGNTTEPEVHLEFVDLGREHSLGWFRLSDLQLIIDTYKNGYTA